MAQLRQWASIWQKCSSDPNFSVWYLQTIAVVIDHLAETNKLKVYQDGEETLAPLDIDSTRSLLQVLLALVSNPVTKQTINTTELKKKLEDTTNEKSADKPKKKEKVSDKDELLLIATRTLNTLCGRSDKNKEMIAELDIPAALFRYVKLHCDFKYLEIGYQQSTLSIPMTCLLR